MFPKIYLSELDLLKALFSATRESDDDPNTVYTILKANRNKLNDRFVKELQTWTQETLPILNIEERRQRAKDIGNLSILIRGFTLGNQAHNVEIAITGYEIFSTIFTRDESAENWAATQNNLGVAYCTRILGDKAQNIEQAITCYYKALEVRTRKEFPADWADTQNNLGNVYRERILGEKDENLERAIRCHQRALCIHKREADSIKWAFTQYCLGNAYSDRILGERDKNQERAIQCYENAWQVYTRTSDPYKWADLQDNLGTVYQERLLGDKSENQEKAIAHHKKALLVHTRRLNPAKWAICQSNLGAAYSARILGEKFENLKSEIQCYKNALLVYTRNAFPLDHAITLFNLGLAYKNSQQFNFAYQTFTAAIETIEALRGLIAPENNTTITDTHKFAKKQIISGENPEREAKRKLAEDWNLLYQAMVEVCLELDYPAQAIEYVERSKTRNLVELLAQNNNYSEFNLISFAQIWELLPDDRTAIVEWYITPKTFIVFIINRQTPYPIVWQPTTTERETVLQALFDWGNKFLDNYEENLKLWKDQLEDTLPILSQILHLDKILSLLPKNCNQLILIPHWFLHLFPLHALPLANQKDQCLLDKFPIGVRYAPSCQLLYMTKNLPCHQPSSNDLLPNLFAIQNPTQDLSYSNLEVPTICNFFHNNQVVAKQNATKTNFYEYNIGQSLRLAHYLHFSCHGYFNSNFSMRSALLLADCYVSAAPDELDPGFYLFIESQKTAVDLSKCLTLGEIFTLKLPECRLVTLSACETGQIDFYNTSDEYIGITSGFLYAGSPSVVSSLWIVQDLSTAFLMIKFYQNLQDLHSVAVALNQAQLWLRDITKAELKAWITANSLPLDPTMRHDLGKRLHKLQDDQKPFQDPFYWAAFCAIGQ